MKAVPKEEHPQAETEAERVKRKRAALKPNRNWVKYAPTMEDNEWSRAAWEAGAAYRKAQKFP